MDHNQIFFKNFKNYRTTCVRFRYHWAMYVQNQWKAGFFFLITSLVCTGSLIYPFCFLKWPSYLVVLVGIMVSITMAHFLTKLYPAGRLAAKHKFLSDAYVDMIPVFVQELKAKELSTWALDLLANKLESVTQVEKDYNLPVDQWQLDVADKLVHKETSFVYIDRNPIYR